MDQNWGRQEGPLFADPAPPQKIMDMDLGDGRLSRKKQQCLLVFIILSLNLDMIVNVCIPYFPYFNSKLFSQNSTVIN